MIFHLDCSIKELENASANELEETIAKLVDADRSGKHFFILRRELSRWATDNLPLSRRDREHLVTIRQNFADRGGLPKVAKAIVNVTIGNEILSIGRDGIFSIGNLELVRGNYLSSSSVLVVENVLADERLYSHIFNEVRMLSDVPSYRYDPVHGGGSGTEAVFDLEIQKKRIVVCIVDHDKSAPMDNASPTARKILSNHRKRNVEVHTPSQCYMGLGCTTIGRELENWIPYCLFKLMTRFRDHASLEELDDVMGDRADGEGQDFWLFFDTKKGIDGEKLKQKYDNGELSSEAIDWICAQIGCEERELEELTISGFGCGIIDAFFESPEAIKGFHTFVRSKQWQCSFANYFEHVLWYFAAPARDRT